jgi:predicted PurR-regulated permease PerM
VEVEPKSFNVRDFVWSGTMTAAGLAADLVVIGFLALYLMVAGDLFRRRFVELAGPTLSRKKITLQILNDISAQISRFLLLRVAISGIVAAGTGLGLWAVGLAQPAAWGVAAGVLNVIPYLGPASIAVAAGLTGFLQFHTLTMAAVASGATIVVSSLEAYVITPWLTSRAAQMNAVAVFIGLVFWGWMWGFPGLILAVPLLMILNAVCDHVEALKPLSALLKE